MDEKRYTVGEVARMAHVTVRALHYYDEIGLLRPSARDATGYRRYEPRDLARLHEILVLRQMDLPLRAIGELLGAGEDDRLLAFRSQRQRLIRSRRRTTAMLRAIEAAIEALEKGVAMDESELFAGFEDHDPSQYEEEVRGRWGTTAAYAESKRRTRSYTEDDLARIKAEAEDVWERMQAVVDEGQRPEGVDAMDLAEEHRWHIDRWFYPCDRATHAALAEMYTADARFKEYFEKRQPGLAVFVQQSIVANAARGHE